MNAWSDQLERAWAVLAPDPESEFASFPLDVNFAGTPCRVALDRQGHRHLLVPVVDETLGAGSRLSVLQAEVRRLRFGSDSADYVDIWCAERDLEHEFDDVIADVLSQVERAPRPGGVALEAIERWRRLFRSRLMRGMTFQAKVGLFAELTVFSSLLDHDPQISPATWRGPLREPHDFECAAQCIEVKGFGPASATIEVHGLAQLATHDGRPLHLALLTVVEDPESGTLVSELISQIASRVPDPITFKSRLAAAGWSPADGYPSEERLSVTETAIVPVTDRTPRLVESSLIHGSPAGLIGVNYTLERESLLAHTSSDSLSSITGAAAV